MVFSRAGNLTLAYMIGMAKTSLDGPCPMYTEKTGVLDVKRPPYSDGQSVEKAPIRFSGLGHPFHSRVG